MPVIQISGSCRFPAARRWTKRSRLLAAISVLVALSLPGGAQACSCAPGVSAESVMADAEMVFTGVAEQSKTSGPNGGVTTFRGIESFKGTSAGDRLQVSHRTGPSASCGLEFADGQTFTLATHRDPSTAALVTSVCSTWMFLPQVGMADRLIQEMRTLAGAKTTLAGVSDMRAYCMAVGNDDTLRPLPRALLDQARALFTSGPGASASFIMESTVARCMDSRVWLCNHGANLVCDKANVSRNSPGASAYCRQNPNAESVPMAATGHATIYSWRCVGFDAAIDRQFDAADSRGFLGANWKRTQP